MQGILKDHRMEYIEVGLREAFRAEGVDITSERDGMLPEADELDAKDTSLSEEQAQLNENKKKLDVRLADIKTQGAEHERRCLPTHPPERHQWCVDNAARLNKIIDEYNEDVRKHNATVEEWKKQVGELKPKWDAFVEAIRAWEEKIKKLIDKVESHFRNLKDCEYLRNDVEIIPSPDVITWRLACHYNCCGLPYLYIFPPLRERPMPAQAELLCRQVKPMCTPGGAFQGSNSLFNKDWALKEGFEHSGKCPSGQMSTEGNTK
ncbi:MAG: hypothetical protein AUJ52_00440 [Elusimicrobia bacterium CG1_02_63_36]|nr:MAG: hypothetical protein AUJ52_00440 [Elusimicrobia bacterium CG1_02_63_36]PIP83951.1 MAG: hypothetical protein COR54_06565 [Elusimicrobia bacterium CG22_combo_CG10-13_8_21_14_all_63_91]PJA17248.1 MAG: hypothetical protein COX66_05015 [Elusimicrobia bacterium CG_4_10_14_0_2_um_filter_63_34]PJB23871.1 MAG: hypothetical protein CO113_16650 [Elusimicrobia bacterium CG_4_9_14_3_um_filter_62_55]